MPTIELFRQLCSRVQIPPINNHLFFPYFIAVPLVVLPPPEAEVACCANRSTTTLEFIRSTTFFTPLACLHGCTEAGGMNERFDPTVLCP
jgi:hypothetical protein